MRNVGGFAISKKKQNEQSLGGRLKHESKRESATECRYNVENVGWLFFWVNGIMEGRVEMVQATCIAKAGRVRVLSGNIKTRMSVLMKIFFKGMVLFRKRIQPAYAVHYVLFQKD